MKRYQVVVAMRLYEEFDQLAEELMDVVCADDLCVCAKGRMIDRNRSKLEDVLKEHYFRPWMAEIRRKLKDLGCEEPTAIYISFPDEPRME